MPSLNQIFGGRKQYLPEIIEILKKQTTIEVEVDGVRLKIDYRRIVIPSLKKHSIPRVLSCGWGSGWEGIVPLAFSLACEGFEVFIISLPGYGDSDNLPPRMIAPNILELMAKVVINFLRCLNIPRAPVIGHSMAAIIAMKAARKEPMLVEKIVLLNASGIRQYRNIFSKILMAKRFILSGARLHLRYKWMSFLSKEDDYIIELVSWCGKQKSPFGKGRFKQRIVEFLDICHSCLLEDAKKAPFTFVVYIAGAKDTVFKPFKGKGLLLEAISRHRKVESSILAGVPHNPTLFHSEITAAMIGHFSESYKGGGHEMPQINDDQMEELKRYISASPDATETTKKILLWMLDQTENFSISVELAFSSELEALGKQAVDDVHCMVSVIGKTHIHDFIKSLGLEFPAGRILSRSRDWGEGWQGQVSIGEGDRKILTFNDDEVQKISLPS